MLRRGVAARAALRARRCPAADKAVRQPAQEDVGELVARHRTLAEEVVLTRRLLKAKCAAVAAAKAAVMAAGCLASSKAAVRRLAAATASRERLSAELQSGVRRRRRALQQKRLAAASQKADPLTPEGPGCGGARGALRAAAHPGTSHAGRSGPRPPTQCS
eukprot:TRINITY_DN13139_c0_g1_i1.p2 TRINITY_DN13139_c0_g1~~TRINITY_DN13139_c0_g1_i1.p2  ORF type:complete len:161 (+),score=34.14 TRINITY_DN13139_c0_g1_i1:88-570(+)